MTPALFAQRINQQQDPSREAARFTDQFMSLVGEWDGTDKNSFLDYVHNEVIKPSIQSDIGRSQLRSLTENYIAGQVPYFEATAVDVFTLEHLTNKSRKVTTGTSLPQTDSSAHTQPTMSDNETSVPEPKDQSAAKPKGQKPYVRDNIAVFDKMIPDGKGGMNHIYDIADNVTGITHIACPSSIMGHDFSKDDAVTLYQGWTIIATIDKKDPKEGDEPTFDMLFGSTGVESKPGRNPQYTDRRLNIVTGFPLRQKVENGTPEQKRDAPVEAYLISQGETGKKDVKMYRAVGPKNNPVILELGDAYKLIARASMIKNGCEVTVANIKEGQPFKMATVKARILSPDEKAKLYQSEGPRQGSSRRL